MVTLEVNCNKQGYGNIPKALRKTWGNKLNIIPNNNAGVIYPRDGDLEDVKKSLEILLQDIEHRIEVNNKKDQEEDKEDG